jgi:phosphoserine phosphatase
VNKEMMYSLICIHVSLQARQPGGAVLFICYAGVQMREAVAAKADWTVFDFQELIAELP